MTRLLDTLAVAARLDDLLDDITWNVTSHPGGVLIHLSGADTVKAERVAHDIADRLELNQARSADPLTTRWLGHAWVAGEDDTQRMVPVRLEQVHVSFGKELVGT